MQRSCFCDCPTAHLQVHYGRASLSPLSRLSAYFVFGRESLDVAACARQLVDYAAAPLNPEGMTAVLVILDQPLLWALPELREAVAALQGQQVLAACALNAECAQIPAEAGRG